LSPFFFFYLLGGGCCGAAAENSGSGLITAGGTADSALSPLSESTPADDDDDWFLFLPALLIKRQPAGPPAGNPDGHCSVPAEGQAEGVSQPDHVAGDGTPQSCTSEAFVSAVAQGDFITFDCGPRSVTITIEQTAKVFNNTEPKIVIDGGGKVALSGNGNGQQRILYMNTCDPDQVWTTSHCQNQDHPQLTVQNLTFIKGNSKGESTYDGGGAIYNAGNFFTLTLCGIKIENKQANEGGGAIFFVGSDLSRPLVIQHSHLSDNPSYGFETPGYPGIFFLGNGEPQVSDSTIE
jgi:hypothetical protein